MIKVNELRIGNYIIEEEGNIAKVIGFKPFDHSVRCDEEEGCEILVDVYNSDGLAGHGRLSNSKKSRAIPVNTEWLERFGGEKTLTPFFCIDMPGNIGQIHINPKNGMIWLKHHRNESTNINPHTENVYHVHQLQNLYFALTGEELKLKDQ